LYSRKTAKTAEFTYWLFLFFCKLKQNRKSDDDAVVFACEVQTIELTLYKLKF